MKKLLLLLAAVLSLTVAHAQGWKYQNSNLINNQHGAICPVNKDTVFAIADDGKFLKTYNGGTNWTTQNTGFSTHFFDLSFYGADTGYAVGQHGTIIKTTDGGTNWIALPSGTTKNLFSISAKAPNNLWVVGDSGIILHSVDYGITWTKNNSLTNKNLNSIRFKNSSIGFIAGNGGTLFNTVNGGTHWNTVPIVTTKDLFSLSVTNNYAYVLAGSVMNGYIFSGNELFKTSNNSNWTAGSLPYTPTGWCKLFFKNDSLGFTISSNCTTNSQCFIHIQKTANHGQSWSVSLNSSFPSSGPTFPGLNYDDIIFVSDSIGYAFSGNHILKTSDGGVFVNTKEENDIVFLKIGPNPFSSSATLSVGTPSEQSSLTLKNATLTVYNCLGQQVKQLENISGHTITLQRDNLPAGLYFFRLAEGNKFYSTEKLVITD